MLSWKYHTLSTGAQGLFERAQQTRDIAWRDSESRRFTAFFPKELMTFIWPFSPGTQQNIRKHTALGLEPLKFPFTTHVYFSDYMFTQNLKTERKKASELRWITIIFLPHLVLGYHKWSQSNTLPSAKFTYNSILCRVDST